jgi:hypothetical protein
VRDGRLLLLETILSFTTNPVNPAMAVNILILKVRYDRRTLEEFEP